MSTFRGIVTEFPDIRIDYFRHQPGTKPALACFLSHIHSDHLQGLEGFYGGPFIYCSEATKELLIRLERRAHRINFAKQIVEAHNFTHADKKLKLKTIPLETPTMIELGNERSIRVTLFNVVLFRNEFGVHGNSVSLQANHCPGAVMFLIENDEKAILYTGDIRAEPWWVEAIARHPVLIPYTMGIKRLSRIYLDTSCASKETVYQEFPTKAEGIRELIEKIMKYPKNTTFHFSTWTFGYEDVWVALSAAFNTKIHVDRYQHRLFRSIRGNSISSQGPYLNGFTFGNSTIEGRLTNNPECQFHSCDRRLDCPGLQGKEVVYIVPIVARVGNIEVQEIGIGQGDLESHSELPLHSENLKTLINILGSSMSPEVQELLIHAGRSRGEALPLEWGTDEKIAFSVLSKVLENVAETKELTKPELVIDGAEVKKQWDAKVEESILGESGEWLPTRLSFPYSRHSSHNELRHLVEKFRPMDVYPCVVDENNWSESRSIRALFGDLCSGNQFAHDEEMRLQEQLRRNMERQVLPRHGISSSEQRSSQRNDSNLGDVNEQVCYEQLRILKATKTRSVSKMKGALKREASDGDNKDSGVITREKRSRLDFEIITRQLKGTEQGTGCGEQKIKTVPLSDQEKGPGAVKEQGKNAQERVLGDTIDETHLPADLGGLSYMSHVPRQRTDTSPFPLENHPPKSRTEGRSWKERRTENHQPHISRSQTTVVGVSSEEYEGILTEKHTRLGPTQHSARPIITYQKEPPKYMGQKMGSSSNTRIPRGIFGIHTTGHLPLPLPPDMDVNFDLEELREATMSALQINGRSWWNVNLESTRSKWKYEEEVEL